MEGLCYNPSMSIFDKLKDEKSVGQLKRAVMRDAFYNGKIMEIRKKMNNHAEAHGAMPTNPEMLKLYEEMVAEGKEVESAGVRQILKRLKVRSNSGVAVVSLLTKPYTCPGRCIYCPTEKNMPKSYLSREPAAARALTNRFDPYKQITMRLKALTMNGHPIDKVEMIFIGGTFNYYPRDYQEWFTKESFRACNNWGLEKNDINYIDASYTFLNQNIESSKSDDSESKENIEVKDNKTEIKTLSLIDLQNINEQRVARIIGLSIETRPDYINPLELKWLRYLGVTKVEIGVQSLDDDVLAFNKREMTERDIAISSEILRDYGYKIVYHMMPNLPSSDREKDIKMFKDLYNGLYHHPDMMKVYPCMTVRGSLLYKLYTQRKIDYQPYNDAELTEVLAMCEREVKPYTRLIRVIRDIPADYIVAGSRKSNLREIIDQYQKDRGFKQIDIRAREIRDGEIYPNDYTLTETVYETAHGTEYFLQFENKEQNKLAGFLRLRLPNNPHLNPPAGGGLPPQTGSHFTPPLEGGVGGGGSNWGIASWLVKSKEELSQIKILNKENIDDRSKEEYVGLDSIDDTLHGAALVRELHVYGTMKRVGQEGNQSQHTGMGKRLLARAEEIAGGDNIHKAVYKKVAIISGVGVRDYYRKRGYTLEGTYMVKGV